MMSGNQFDDLARDLAEGMPRRRLLRYVGSALVGAAVAAVTRIPAFAGERRPDDPGQPSQFAVNGVPVAPVRLNGFPIIAPWLNGVRVNGVQLNGVQVNGVRLNGVRLNGVSVSGILLNGVRLNGTEFCTGFRVLNPRSRECECPAHSTFDQATRTCRCEKGYEFDAAHTQCRRKVTLNGTSVVLS